MNTTAIPAASPARLLCPKEKSTPKTFKGVSLDVLAIGERSMVTKMNYVKGNVATMHQHPQEQCGYVISGLYRLRTGGERPVEALLQAGDSYAIPGHLPHSMEVLESGEVVDVFTPHRPDYLPA